jgi:hypothetical protein
MIVASAVLFEGVEEPLVMWALSKFEALIFEQGDGVGIFHSRGFRLIAFSRISSREALIESRESLIELSSAVISLK